MPPSGRRRFIQATQQEWDQFLRRRIDDQTGVVLMIDGIRVGGHLVVVAHDLPTTDRVPYPNPVGGHRSSSDLIRDETLTILRMARRPSRESGRQAVACSDHVRPAGRFSC